MHDCQLLFTLYLRWQQISMTSFHSPNSINMYMVLALKYRVMMTRTIMSKVEWGKMENGEGFERIHSKHARIKNELAR